MGLPDDYRRKAATQRQLANDLMDTSPLIRVDGDGKHHTQNLVTAIVGHVNAMALEIAADQMDYLRMSVTEDSKVSAAHKIIERNNALRIAAATENWDEFNRIAAGGDPSGNDDSGSDGSQGRDSSTGADGGG